ncbi:hypothetical protein J2Y48_001652 [Mycoplana sp. BE70]|nr:hypothetical protein [Mycoplana sp. BE70]
MTLIEPEAAAAVLENDPGARAYDSASERMKRRIDERDGVSLAIDNRDVDRVAIRQGDIGQIGHRAVALDRGRERTRIVSRQQSIDGHIHLIRIADVPVSIAIGEPTRLDLQMQSLNTAWTEPLQIKFRKDVEHQQCRQALIVGRHLVYVMAAVGNAHWLDILAGGGGKIIECMESAERLKAADKILGDSAFVKARPAPRCNRSQRRRQFGLNVHGTRLQRSAILQKQTGGILIPGQCAECIIPVECNPIMDHIAALRIADGGLEDFVQTFATVVLDQAAPRINRARNGHRMRPMGGYLRKVAFDVPLQGGGLWRATGAIKGKHVALAFRRIEDKTVATDACRLRLDHCLDSGGANGGIHRVATGTKHFDGRER